MNKTKLSLAAILLASATGYGAIVNQIGTFNNWTTTWNALPGADETANASLPGTVDFVGNAASPGAYWYDDGSYVFFRMRVNYDGTVTQSIDGKGTFKDTLLVLIDIGGAGAFDYGFTWDANSNPTANHGLEMSILGTDANSWGGVKPADFDGSTGKNAKDINGDIAGRGYDGYVRTVDHQYTAAFGDTTFVDFAIAWSYLNLQKANGLTLANTPIENWNIALGSIENANDHNFINADIGSGADPTSLTTAGWVAIPEPATALLLAIGGGLTWLVRMKQRW